MRLKLMAFNVQDLFLRLAYPVEPKDLTALNEDEWQLLGAGDDVPMKPLAKLRGLGRVFRDEKPDFALLTEVGGPESLANFSRLFLEDGYDQYLLPGNSNRGIENAFLVRKGLPLSVTVKTHRDWPVRFQYLHEIDPAAHELTVAHAATLKLGDPNDRRLSRDIPEMRVYAPGATTPSLVLLLAHLKSGWDSDRVDPEGTQRRAGESRALKEIREAIQNELGPTVPIVIAGDLNASAQVGATDPELQWVHDHSDLVDCLEIAARQTFERITHVTYFGSEGHAAQIDFILVPAILAPVVEKDATYVYRYRFEDDPAEVQMPSSLRDRWLLPSDHYPVVCVVDLPLLGVV